VANGATDWSTDPFISTFDTAYHFNLLDTQIYKRFKAQNCSYYWQEIKPNLPGDCTSLLLKMAETFNYMNLYNLIEPLNAPLKDQIHLESGQKVCRPTTQHFVRDMHDEIFNPHIEDCKSPHNLGQAQKPNILDWLSSSEVKRAFHVPEKVKQNYTGSNSTVLG
jgi:hypothetical protein